MIAPLRLAGGVALLGIVGWAGWAGVSAWYLTPRTDVIKKIDAAQEKYDRYRRALDNDANLSRTIDALVDRTLGGDLEVVDHRLRARLNRLVEMVGLSNATIGTGRARVRATPARRLFRGELRDEPDFVELEATISGTGTLGQVLALVDRVDAEPWLKHVTQLKIDPESDANSCDVTIRLVTIFVPGRVPDDEVIVAYDESRQDRYAALLSRHPFLIPKALPPPAQPAVVVSAEPPPQPPAYAYDQWVLTGIASIADNPEAWVLNTQSSETRKLAVGESLHEVVFEGANSDDLGVFRQGDERFMIALGARLNDRMPLAR